MTDKIDIATNLVLAKLAEKYSDFGTNTETAATVIEGIKAALSDAGSAIKDANSFGTAEANASQAFFTEALNYETRAANLLKMLELLTK